MPNELDFPYTKERLLRLLDSLDISYQLAEHDAVYNSVEADAVTDALPGFRAKNLFLANADKSRFYLYQCDENRRVNLKQLANLLPDSRLQFADESFLEAHLGITRGAVTIFGLVNDRQGAVTAVLEKEVLEADQILLHPLVNTATVVIDQQGLRKFLYYAGRPVRVFDPDQNRIESMDAPA
jgi:Ala-tRNA(Pro) deacylase